MDQDGVIIAGHTRYKAALMLGYDSVPTHYANDLTPDQVAAYRLVDNKTHELSIWDDDLLQAELKKLSELEFDMEAFGFEAMGEVADKEMLADEAFNPEPPKEPKAKMGEVYLLGNHRLMCGDSTIQRDVERLMDGEHSDCLLYTSRCV